MTYTFHPVATLTAEIEASVASSNETVIKFKSKEKKGYFTSVPALSDNSVHMFINTDAGMSAARDWIDSLRKEAAKRRFDAGAMFSQADITNQALIELAQATSDNVRLTKDNIEKAFDSGWANTIAYALILERDAEGAVILLGDDVEAKKSYWDSEQAQKFLKIAANYKQYLVRGAERKPTFESEAIKSKVLAAVENLDQEEQLVQKLVEKLNDAPVAMVDESAL
jgi:hypothetical protein